jgi:enamine deaminase RidA (YjgF/YER057c/UK114 family)
MIDRGKSTIVRHGVGPRSSQIVVHAGIVYLAGIVSAEPERRSIAQQTRDILDVIDSHLTSVGTNKSRLLSATIWLADIASYDEMNAVWDAWVAPGNTPARATVEAALAEPKYKVEIMVIAAG